MEDREDEMESDKDDKQSYTWDVGVRMRKVMRVQMEVPCLYQLYSKNVSMRRRKILKYVIRYNDRCN